MLENFDFIESVKDLPDYARAVLLDLTKVSPTKATSFEVYLDETEQQKLQKITVEAKRHAFVVCRFVAKQLIGEFFGLDPLTLRFQYTERGKPYVNVPGVEFNISHSGDYALIGVSHHKIGVDIEKMKPNRNFKGLAEAVLSEDERRWVFGGSNQVSPHEEMIKRFYQLWTLKEARLKCDGDGLAGHFPAATFDAEKGWGYLNYFVYLYFNKNKYTCAICINK